MASERTEELYRVLLSKGYPKELCAEIAYKNMNTDYTATRMLGYLYRYTNPKIEDLVDEMLAILSMIVRLNAEDCIIKSYLAAGLLTFDI